MVKNTLLGLAVFESYGAVIEYAASSSYLSTMDVVEHTAASKESRDPYVKATVAAHVLGGAVGGGAHGLLLWIWESAASSSAVAGTGAGTVASVLSPSSGPGLHRSVLHHGTAHAVLFSAFEASKRSMLMVLGRCQNNDIQRNSVEYLGVVAVAGGLAGQAQHWISHYSEHILMQNHRQPFLSALPSRPTFRPLLMAFVPSSIAFVAFEYGRYD